MAIKKIKFCDSKRCKKIIEPEQSYLHFPFYGFNGRDFCNEICLKDWAVDVSDVRGKLPEIQTD